jgi:hypothetical protein
MRSSVMASATDVITEDRWLFPYGLELVIKQRDIGETVVSIHAPPYVGRDFLDPPPRSLQDKTRPM